MHCPLCGHGDDKVVDSREAEGGKAIRRRRECLSCGQRYNTFERVDETQVMVEKRSGSVEPFDKEKLVSGIQKACKNRSVSDEQVERLADDVLETLKSQGTSIPTADLGKEVLERLRALDEVAYLRFASVYKDFKELTDFERELGFLQKKIPPKQKV